MATDPITIRLPGPPVPWARAWGGKTTKHFTPPRQRSYMNMVKVVGKFAMKGKKPLQGPLRADFLFVCQGKESGWKTTRPDSSNLVKIVEDALNGVVYYDDSQLCYTTIFKMYGPEPLMELVITPMDN